MNETHPNRRLRISTIHVPTADGFTRACTEDWELAAVLARYALEEHQ